MAVQNDFSKGSILSHMARIALPMTLAQFVNILYNIIDRVFIGRIPDHATEALTGLGVAFPICTLAKNDSKHDQHFCDDPTRTGERKQNGEHAIEQSKVSGKRNTDDYGGIRIRPRSCPKVIIASWFGKESN